MDLVCTFLVVISGNPAAQVVAHLMAEQTAGAGAGAVRFRRPTLHHQPQKILVGHANGPAIGTPLSLRPRPYG